MNSELARGPRDSVSWKAMDIFLFANGQQYSPPRKYHLRSEELEFWEGTLNYLARAHYGPSVPVVKIICLDDEKIRTPLISIELCAAPFTGVIQYKMIEIYTTDGKKIDGPMELSNGGTYVAVIPPDTFIDTGYEKYLLKASRSWERRQKMLSGTMEVSNPDAGEKPIIEDQEEISVEVLEDGKLSVEPKPESSLGGRPIRLSTAKAVIDTLIDTKRRSISTPNSNIPKKNVRSTTPKKNLMRTKKIAKTTIKTKNSKITDTRELSKNKVKITSNNIPSNAEVEYDLETKESYKTIILDKPTQLEVPSIANSLYTNTVRDSLSSHVQAEPNEQHTSNDQECRNIIKQIVEKVLYKKSISSDAKRPSRKLSKNRFDKYFTLINKGDIVSLKLNIEVKNAEGITTIPKENKEKLIDTIPFEKYTEKSSQTNLEAEISTISLHAQHANESRKGSLETIISDIYFRRQYGRSKVIILKCPCCDHQCIIDEMSSLTTSTKDQHSKNIVIVMPVNTANEAEAQNNFNVNKPLENRTDEEENQSFSTSDLSTPHAEAQCNELVKKLGYDKYENAEMEVLKTDPQKQFVPLKMGSRSTHSSFVNFGDTNKIIVKSSSLEGNKLDACILTDWNGVILEAKVDDDGNYSFYLPSLQTLRHYNL